MNDINQLPLADLKEESLRLLALARQQGITLRLFGGMAFHLRCPSSNLPGLQRTYGDLDFVIDKASLGRIEPFFKQAGYSPDRTINTLYGSRRQLYFDTVNNRQVDILIDEFEMCHTIPLNKRLKIEKTTLPLSELLLTKAQIVEMNHKDVLDVCAVMIDHTTGMQDGDCINLQILQALCADDWGLFTTVTENFNKISGIVKNAKINLPQETSLLLLDRIGAINQALINKPKSARWKMRAVVGKRVPWYEKVEEVQR